MSKKTPVSAFSTSPKVETYLNRLQKESGKNRSQIIRDLIISDVKNTKVNQKQQYSTDPTSVVKSFIDLLIHHRTAEFIFISQAIIVNNNKVLLVLPPKKGFLIKSSTWDFPSCICNTLNPYNELSNYLKKNFGSSLVIDRLITGRIVPDQTVSAKTLLSINFLCKFKSKTIKLFPNTKWVPISDICRYFTHSVGDDLILWLTQFK